MAGSGVEQTALRLLGAVHDLSGGKLNERVPIVVPGEPGKGAAPKAGMDPGSIDDEVSTRYLLDQGFIEAVGTPAAGEAQEYELTVAGLDRAREVRGLGGSDRIERGGMSDGTQKMLVTAIGIVGSQILARPLTRFIAEQVPERRGVRDDVLEAALKGLARTIALAIASVLVRKLALSRR